MKKTAEKLLSSSLHSVKSTRWFVGSLLLMLTLTAASCVREHPNSPDKISDGELSVTLNMDIPYSSSAQTRAIGKTEENTIESIYVLAFAVQPDGKELFEYHSIAKVATGHVPGVPSQAFTAKVRLKSYKQRFVIIANAKTQVDTLLLNNWVGGLKDDMLKTLTVSLAPTDDKWNTLNVGNYTKLPMWGESVKTTITENTTTLGVISMFRMIAKIDVKLNNVLQNANLFNEFKLASVHLYNTSKIGRVTPSTAAGDWDLTTTPGEPFVINPSMPTGWTDADRYVGPLAYTDFGTPGVAEQSMIGAIYTFEIPTNLDAPKRPCLIVGGYYLDPVTGLDANQSYYRLDFIRKSDGVFMPILRNHRYEFNIVNVKGRGYPTVDEAFNALPINMEVEIIKWNESGMNNGVSDGQYFLSVSKNEFNFFRDAQIGEGNDNILYVMTDYTTTTTTPGAKSGWYVDKIVDAADGTTVVNWLTLTPENDNVTPNSKTKVVMTFGENTGTGDRAAIIWLAAGRMRFAVKVTQTNTSDIRVRIIDFTTKVELTELLFASSVGVDPTPQSFIVDWAPILADLTVNTTTIVTNAFPTGAISPALGNVLGGNGGTGTITYNISPKMLTAAEITANPFMGKASKVDFSTTNGISSESKSILLRQINYNLLTDIAPNYVIESQTETINVKANFPWTITGVIDTYDILQSENSLIGKTGGNNITPGDDLSFTMSSETPDASKHGKTATITITNLIDNTPWTITITAIEYLYVGYFGGELVLNNGKYKFERKLFVQVKDASAGTEWGPQTPVGGGASSVWDGKGNTFNLRSDDTYLAANLCFTKNANYASINSVSHADYVWYLPAQNQLMAAYGAQASFGSDSFGSAYYWSVTEISATSSWDLYFNNGYTYTYYKTASFRVRCVREL